MSASLVGSEMCIRDSLELQLKRSPFSADSKPCARTVRHVGLVETAASVSYTHLTLPTICSV
eukprot:4228345-Alexandrium_andersonii.AAC.1